MCLCVTLQCSEVECPDSRVQQLENVKDQSVGVAAELQDISSKASESVDDVFNLPSQAVASPDQDIGSCAPCDTNEVTHNEIESESSEKFDVAGSEPVCDKTVTADDETGDVAPCHALDKTFTDFSNEQSASEDIAAVGDDNVIGAETVNTDLSENESQLASHSVDGVNADVEVPDSQSQPADIVDNSASSDVLIGEKQIVYVDSNVSECKELHDGTDDFHVSSVLPENIVNIEVENTEAFGDDGALTLVEEDLPCNSHSTVTQSVDVGDVIAASDAEVVVSDGLVDIKSHTKPESVETEAQKPADDLPECLSNDADEFMVAHHRTGGGDSVPIDGEMVDSGIGAEATSQVESGDNKSAELACCEPADSNVVELATDSDVAMAESDSQPAVSVDTDTEIHAAHVEHLDIGNAAEADVISAGGDDILVEPHGLQSISVDRSPTDVNESLSVQEETVAETGADDTCTSGDWLDKVVDVSNVSFVSRDDIADGPCDDIGKEQERNSESVDKEPELNTAAVASDGVSAAKAVETVSKTVVADDADTGKTVETAPEAAAADDTTVETTAETVVTAHDDGSVPVVETGVSVDSNDVSSAAANETVSETVVADDSVTAAEATRTATDSTPETVVAGNTDSGTVTETGVSVDTNNTTARETTPEIVVTAVADSVATPDTVTTVDANATAEKSRLYSKNVAKSDTSGAGPVASLAANISNVGMVGTVTPAQQDVKVTGDQPVVMRKKLAPQTDSAVDKENEPAKIHKVILDYYYYWAGNAGCR